MVDGGGPVGRLFVWAENTQPFRLEQIDNPGRELVVRSDNGEINPVFFGKTRELRQIVCRNGNVFANSFGTGIPGRAVNAIGIGRLRQLPHQCMLAASAADDENLHRGERASATNEKQVRRGASRRTSWLRRASPYQ